MSAQPCMCGAADCERCHPGCTERARLDAALDDVVETITLHGQFPAPRSHRPHRFDLWDFIAEHYCRAEVTDIALNVLTLSGHDLTDYVLRKQRALEKTLRDHLRDSDLVRERAQELLEEATEEA